MKDSDEIDAEKEIKKAKHDVKTKIKNTVINAEGELEKLDSKGNEFLSEAKKNVANKIKKMRKS